MFGIGCGVVVLFHMAVLGASAIVLLACAARAFYRPAEETRWAHCGIGVAAIGGLFAAVPLVQAALAVWALAFVAVAVGIGLARARRQVLVGAGAIVVGEVVTILASMSEINAERTRLCMGHAQSCLGHAVDRYSAGICGYEGVGYFAGLGFVAFVILVQLVLIGTNAWMSRGEGSVR